MSGKNISIAPIILAGGLGTRLRSVMPERPKVLAPVNGKPFLSYLLDKLLLSGFTEAVLCVGYKAEMIEAEYGNGGRGLNLSYSREDTPLGTAGAVRKALEMVKTDTILVMNGDSYCDTDLGAFIEWHEQHQERPSLLIVELENSSRYGSVTIDKCAKITTFEEKKDTSSIGMPPPGMINAGIYLIPKSIMRNIPADTNLSFEKDIFPNWIVDGLYGLKTNAKFIDIGTPESWKNAGKIFLGKTDDGSGQ